MTITKRDCAGRISQINVLERLSEFMGDTLAEKYGVTRTRILQLWRGEHIPSKS